MAKTQVMKNIFYCPDDKKTAVKNDKINSYEWLGISVFNVDPPFFPYNPNKSIYFYINRYYNAKYAENRAWKGEKRYGKR
ncbi:hypothetical protein HYU09_02775 [Candidatus Woesearchaeota archaeon]|nr:hypothetical protein [Candidatus Woesearchaeota archaeon]